MSLLSEQLTRQILGPNASPNKLAQLRAKLPSATPPQEYSQQKPKEEDVDSKIKRPLGAQNTGGFCRALCRRTPQSKTTPRL